MKVKLLKKVRKRYSIIKVTKLGTNPNINELEGKRIFGLPFYVLMDKKFYTNYNKLYSKTYNGSYNKLKEWIWGEYGGNFKNKNMGHTKVWWSNK